eukprot:TRINITY_DN22218_c0_g1_i1.p1 TRINITY_DN22218_c0_g1~~TRINITY_DN22218_c0_g1_i1.p1  ORF type:complete len:404 (+),score=72.91 TRINITY_DN22218_c0_g1_i1:78-1289(+)
MAPTSYSTRVPRRGKGRSDRGRPSVVSKTTSAGSIAPTGEKFCSGSSLQKQDVEQDKEPDHEDERIHEYLKQSRKSWAKNEVPHIPLNEVLDDPCDTESDSGESTSSQTELMKPTPPEPVQPEPTPELPTTVKRGSKAKITGRRGAKAIPKITMMAAYGNSRRKQNHSRLKNTARAIVNQVRSSDLKEGITDNAIQFLDESNQLPKLPAGDVPAVYNRDEMVDMLMSGGTPYNIPLSQSSTERQSEKVLEDRHRALMDFVRNARDEFGDHLFSSIDEKTMEPETLYNLLCAQPNLLTYFVTPRFSSGPPIPSIAHTTIQYSGTDHPRRKVHARRGGDGGPNSMPETVIKPTAPAAFQKNKHEGHILPPSVWSLTLPNIRQGGSLKEKEPQSKPETEVVSLPPI